MSRKFLTALDLTKNELQNAAVQSLASAPSSPVKFQLFGNTTDNTLYWWDGAQWIAAKAAAGATPAGTVTTSAVGDAGVVGVSTNFAREDHKHGREAFGAVSSMQTFGQSLVNGSATTVARSDHIHGTPTHDDIAHSGIHLNALAQPTAPVNFGGQIATNLAAPSGGTDAATKTYVDGLVTGMTWKSAVRAATIANITLSGAQTIDGVSVVANDRVLVKNQSTGAQNGIYVAAAGAWTRATDADTSAELVDAAVFVAEGTTNADTSWVQTANAPITVDTTALTFVQFFGSAAYTAGAGLTQSGTTFNVGAGTGITVNADDVAIGDAELLAIAGLTSAADRLPYFTGLGTAALATFTPFARTLVDDTDQTTMRTTLGLTPGVNVQPYDPDLDALVARWTSQSAGGPAQLQFAEQTTNGTNVVTLAAPAALGSDITVSLPTVAGNLLTEGRTISTTAPLTGGGDLSANRTLDISTFTATVKGAVPPPTTATGKFLRDDGTWQVAGAVNKFVDATVGGATSKVVNHALNTRNVIVDVFRTASPYDTIDCDVERTDANNVTLRFATAPATNEYTCVVVG